MKKVEQSGSHTECPSKLGSLIINQGSQVELGGLAESEVRLAMAEIPVLPDAHDQLTGRLHEQLRQAKKLAWELLASYSGTWKERAEAAERRELDHVKEINELSNVISAQRSEIHGLELQIKGT